MAHDRRRETIATIINTRTKRKLPCGAYGLLSSPPKATSRPRSRATTSMQQQQQREVNYTCLRLSFSLTSSTKTGSLKRTRKRRLDNRRRSLSFLLLLLGVPFLLLLGDVNAQDIGSNATAGGIIGNFTNISGATVPPIATTTAIDVAPSGPTTSIGGDSNNIHTNAQSIKELTFAVIPKRVEGEFIGQVKLGCETEALRLSALLKWQNTQVKCLFDGIRSGDTSSNLTIAERQANFIEELLFGPNSTSRPIHGLAIAVSSEEVLTPIIDKVIATKNIPVTTFDSDAPSSRRSYYIGTNNTFMGQQLARVMETLRPDGGLFGIIGGSSPNLMERVQGIRNELFHASTFRGQWQELPGSPWDSSGTSVEDMIEQMDIWAAQYQPDVIVSVRAGPMSAVFDEATNTTRYPWMEFVDQHREKGITLLSADDLQHQLVMLKSAYVNGLVGQMPYTMGQWSVRALFEMHQNPNATTLSMSDQDGIIEDDFIGTNVISHIHIPLVLPPIDVDHHLIGNLAYMGYTLFAIVALFSLSFGAWAFYRRNVRVVRVAQPRFLIMIALGCLIFGSMMVPLGMDDGGGDQFNCAVVSSSDQPVDHCVAICMSLPWLGSIGFTIIFSALYSKTRRVNKIFKSTTDFGRVKVKESDVLLPFFILLGLNVVILICWSVIDPLTYVREADYARDGWNRVISTRGQCHSNNQMWFLVCLGIINGSVLLLANWQAFEARDIEAEFAETKYIGLCMASLLQAALIGIPVLAVVEDKPEALYTVSTLLVFLICMVVLLMMFVPKVLYTQQFLNMSHQEQKQFMADVIGKTSKASAAYKARQSENPSGSTGNQTLSVLSRPFGHISQMGKGSRSQAMPSLSAPSETGPTASKQVIASSCPNPPVPQPDFESKSEYEDTPKDDVLEGNTSSTGTEPGMMFFRKSTVQLTPGFILSGEANRK